MANPAEEILNKLYSVALSKVYRLEVKADKNKGIIKWGRKNDYSDYLLGLAENQAEHGAILKTKSEYLTGLGIEVEDPRLQEWIKKANPTENWDKVKEKSEIDKPIFGAYTLKIVPNIFGKPLEHYQLDYGKLRMSICGKEVIYCDDWSLSEYECPRVHYPIWFKGCREVSIYIHKDYFPTTKKIKSYYGRPDYSSIITTLDTEVRFDTYFNVLVQNDFNPGALVTIFKNNPAKNEKDYIVGNLKGEHSGEENPGNVIVNFTDQGGKGAEVQNLGSTDLDKKYAEVSKRDQGKIIIGHRIPAVLAGIQTEGKLGISQELRQSHELFINKYAQPNQKPFIETLELFSTVELGFDTKGMFKVKQLPLIDEEMPLDNQNVINAIGQQAFADYVFKKFNIKKPEIIGADGMPVQEASAVNDNMKGLSAAENADVLRIVRDFQRGRSGMTEAMAISRISSYGVSEAEAKKWLGIKEETALKVQMSKHKSSVFLSLYKKYAHKVAKDEVLSTEEVKNKIDFVKLSTVQLSEQTLTPNQLRNGILNQIKGNPSITAEELATNFGIGVQEAQSKIEWLVSKKLLSSTGKGFEPTDKGISKNTKTKKEIYTEYYYDKRSGVPGPVIMETTRDECRDLYRMYGEESLALSFDVINRMENEFGDNLFDYKGGYYTDPVTGETTPWCRHGWWAVTKIREVEA